MSREGLLAPQVRRVPRRYHGQPGCMDPVNLTRTRTKRCWQLTKRCWQRAGSELRSRHGAESTPVSSELSVCPTGITRRRRQRRRSIGDANERRGAASGEESGPERPRAAHPFLATDKDIVPIRTARNSNDEEETIVDDEETTRTRRTWTNVTN